MSGDEQLHVLLADESSKSYQVVAAIKESQDRGAKAIGLVLGSSFTSGILASVFVEKGNWTYIQSLFVIMLIFSLGWATLASIKLAVQPSLSSALFCKEDLNDNDWSDILLEILRKTENDARHLIFALVCVVGTTLNIVLFSNALLLGSCNSEFARTTDWAALVCSTPNAENEERRSPSSDSSTISAPPASSNPLTQAGRAPARWGGAATPVTCALCQPLPSTPSAMRHAAKAPARRDGQALVRRLRLDSGRRGASYL